MADDLTSAEVVRMLRDGANDIELEGTAAQAGPYPDELRAAATLIEEITWGDLRRARALIEKEPQP